METTKSEDAGTHSRAFSLLRYFAIATAEDARAAGGMRRPLAHAALFSATP